MSIERDDWLPALPSGWAAVPAKSLFSLRSEKSRPDDVHLTPSQKYGVIPQSEYMEITGSRVVLNLVGSDNMKHVEPGDFVIHLRSFQGGVEFSQHRGKVSAAYTVLTPTPLAEPRFFRWLLKSERYIQALQVSVDQLRDGQSIRYGDFAKIDLPLAPPDTQRRIADYLDRETATIDALIEKQRQLSDALRTRRRAAVLARTGFLGVRPASAASSEPWLESAPSHWPRMHVRRLFDLTSGAGFPPELQGVTDEELAFYKVRDLGRADSYGRLGEPEDTISRETADKLRAKVLPSGTLVMAKIGAALLLGRIRVATRPSCIDNNMLALSPKSLLHPRYAAYMLEGLLLERLVQPGAVPSLNEKEFRGTVFPVPPLDEQREIADHLDRETAKIDTLIAKAERFIDLAQERRAALITAAVTGQIEIPT
ncbi:type I restriction enzyme S subunit [Micrococcus cohnii]|uniref:Type I restriction enzyme S subunit n=1 Tax=Micrococcus cohnii TaxID=993416 RepID=A0A7W7GPN5_9MICC|nr:restriction endonuclease subunit S [Micrococcus cohnii]MBB4735954.1 type I restriction enzyme S subunit [Micrococcus cohnii]